MIPQLSGTLGYLSPSRTVVTSFTPRQCRKNNNDYYEEGEWVLFVSGSQTKDNHGSHICCAMSNGEVQLYDAKRLHLIRSFPKVHGENGVITDLIANDNNNNTDNLIVTSGTDGTIRIIDIREQQQQESVATTHCFALPKYNHQYQEQALSVSLGFNGTIAAVGGNRGKIHFLDLRKGGQAHDSCVVGSYTQSHTDDVTKVRFSPSQSSPLLVSGSEDGLACFFDTSQPSEEAAIKTVCNVQSPIRQIGFMGPNYEGMYCLTGSETMNIWSIESGGCLANYSNIRSDLTATIAHHNKNNQQQGGQHSLPNSSPTIDYLVDAFWDAAHQELLLMAGSSNGDACLTAVDYNGSTSRCGSSSYNVTAQFFSSHTLTGGHRGVVRSWSPLSSSVLVTVGEDARLCEWNCVGRQFHSASNTTGNATVIGTNRRSTAASTATAAPSSGLKAKTPSGSVITSSDQNILSGNLSGGGPLRRPRNKRSSGGFSPY